MLFFFTSAAAWLLMATVLGLVSSIKLVAPGFLGIDWLNYGRSQPAFLNALLYGWAFQAVLGVMIWMMARLCRTELKNPITLVVPAISGMPESPLGSSGSSPDTALP